MEKPPVSPIARHYDDLYAAEEKVFGHGKPVAVVAEAVSLLPDHSQVIEFGAGQGRNAVFLAKQGFEVKAIDISAVGMEAINTLAVEKSLSNLKAETGDVREGISGEYDMIVSTFMLHHLTREEALKCIEEIKQHTKEGGLNAIAAFTNEGDFSKINAPRYFYPALGEMRELYSDWEILSYGEVVASAHT